MRHIEPELYEDVRIAAERLVDSGDGITLHRFGEVASIHAGFAVGGACRGLKLLVDVSNREGMIQAVGRWIQQTPTNVRYLGAWTEDGVLHIDGVTIVPSYTEAYLLSVERSQISFYSFATGKVHYVREDNN